VVTPARQALRPLTGYPAIFARRTHSWSFIRGMRVLVVQDNARMATLLQGGLVEEGWADAGTPDRELVLSHGAVRADRAARRVWNGEVEVILAPTQFDLLSLFLRRPGEVVTRGRILAEVWDFGYDARSKIVEQHIALLRRRMQDAGAWDDLETVRGVGYRLLPQPAG
jgi:hypothetical protein